jgi:chaperonin cofactor prefoldin
MSEQSSDLRLSVEEIQQWLGEKEVKIKLLERRIDGMAEEIKKLQAALAQKN